MFKFLKEKLKGAISKLTRKVEEEAKVEEPAKGYVEEKIKEEIQEIPAESALPEEKESLEKAEDEAGVKEEIQKSEEKKIIEELEAGIRETVEEPEAKAEEKIEETKPEEEKKGFFSRLTEKITTTKLSYEKFENLFSDLELALMENNVAFEVIEKIKHDLGKNLVEKPIKRTKIEETIGNSLKASIMDLFKVEKAGLLEKIKAKDEKPFVIAFFGINGSGKTTTIAKIADLLKNSNLSCVLAASDTFRAASIEQLQVHADKLGLKLIKHDYGSDPAAVSFDAIKHAKAKNINVVLIDTAGRLHNQANLMQELKKIVTVTKPDLKLFVGESIAGNDCTEQAQKFNEVIGIDGIILTKADVDEKGGAAVSVSYVTKKPIMYLGVGQEYSDLKEFEPNLIVEGLGL